MIKYFMDSQAAKATDMEDAKSASEPRRRNLARSYLEAGFKTGAALVERAKSSSYLAKVGIEAIEKINSPLTSFAKGQVSLELFTRADYAHAPLKA